MLTLLMTHVLAHHGVNSCLQPSLDNAAVLT